MKKLNLNDFNSPELKHEEMKSIKGGLCINFFGVCHIDGVLDGVKRNTTIRWGPC